MHKWRIKRKEQNYEDKEIIENIKLYYVFGSHFPYFFRFCLCGG